jgi:hypothetical protein
VGYALGIGVADPAAGSGHATHYSAMFAFYSPHRVEADIAYRCSKTAPLTGKPLKQALKIRHFPSPCIGSQRRYVLVFSIDMQFAKLNVDRKFGTYQLETQSCDVPRASLDEWVLTGLLAGRIQRLHCPSSVATATFACAGCRSQDSCPPRTRGYGKKTGAPRMDGSGTIEYLPADGLDGMLLSRNDTRPQAPDVRLRLANGIKVARTLRSAVAYWTVRPSSSINYSARLASLGFVG